MEQLPLTTIPITLTSTMLLSPSFTQNLNSGLTAHQQSTLIVWFWLGSVQCLYFRNLVSFMSLTEPCRRDLAIWTSGITILLLIWRRCQVGAKMVQYNTGLSSLCMTRQPYLLSAFSFCSLCQPHLPSAYFPNASLTYVHGLLHLCATSASLTYFHGLLHLCATSASPTHCLLFLCATSA